MKKKKGKRKISILKILILFLIIYLLITSVYKLVTMPIKNIYVIGNTYIKDKYIIEIADLENYPPFFLTTSRNIYKKIKNDDLILDIKVKKTPFSIYLYIEENIPLFYNKVLGKLVLKDGTNIDEIYNAPTLNNYIPDTIYNDFIKKMGNVEIDVLKRISEIEYKPNEVDTKRFYLLMNDGNIVYLTLDDFLKINNYIETLKTLNGSKGILYWDSGNYFELIKK